MKKPIIGISGSILKYTDETFKDYKKCFVCQDYIDSIEENGGIPLILPITKNQDIIETHMNMIDGLLLTGGEDVTPLYYHQEPMSKCGDTSPMRDQYDYTLIELSKKKHIPILGICRGMQVLNVYHGGTLYQDVSYREKETYKHWQGHSPELVTHSVHIQQDTKLFSILQKDELLVNSFHHQMVREVADGLIVSAYAKDGAVEAIESIDYPFLIGVQWHPEMLHKSVQLMNQIFIKFIEATQQK